VRFTPPEGVQVVQGKVFSFYGSGSGATVSFYVHDDAGGLPGTKKFETTYTATHNQWDVVPITTQVNYDSDFWLVIKIPPVTGSCELWGISDASVNHADRGAVKQETSSWRCPAQLSGDICIRAIVLITGVEQELYPAEIVALNQNMPNPVVDRTTICYVLPWRSKTQLRIYDVTGKVVRTLVNGVQESGVKKVEWNRMDDHGKAVHSGVYFYRLSTGTGDSFTKVMTVF
jgi:hypothetical protein